MSARVRIEPQLPDELRSGELHGAAARAVLVKVEIGAWGGTKSIKTLKQSMAAEANADARLLSAGKRIGRAKGHLDQIHKLRGAIRNWVAKNTVPWGDSGWRLIATEVTSSGRSAYRRWQNYMDEAKISWDREVRDFLKAYPDLIEADKATKTGLGQLFNESDYPPIKDEHGQAIADRFFFDKEGQRKVDEVPDGAIAIGLSRDEEQRIRNRCEEQIAGAYRVAQRDLVTKVVKLTSDTADALQAYDPEKKVSDSSMIRSCPTSRTWPSAWKKATSITTLKLRRCVRNCWKRPAMRPRCYARTPTSARVPPIPRLKCPNVRPNFSLKSGGNDERTKDRRRTDPDQGANAAIKEACLLWSAGAQARPSREYPDPDHGNRWPTHLLQPRVGYDGECGHAGGCHLA